MDAPDDRPIRSRVRRTPTSVDRARDLRKDLSRPEAVLWHHLRAKRLDGLRFRRQHPMGPFITDFYCHEAALVIEVDSSFHAGPESARHDAQRDIWMRERGVAVLRVSASEISRDLRKVLRKILAEARARIETKK